ncbi:MAG: nitroreductase family protein [Planctomycetota bacterium]
MATLPDPLDHRKPDHPIETLLLRRWSPRAMSGAPVAEADLRRLLEAARWAPSTYNEQEWRLRYAHRDGPHWPLFFGLLAKPNQAWCKQAGVLLAACSRRTFARNGKPNPVHSFDTGAACQNLMLQGAAMGLVVHPMAGFDWDAAPQALRLPAEHGVEAMLAIGHPGDPGQLAAEMQKLEVPSGRKAIDEFAGEGPFAG